MWNIQKLTFTLLSLVSFFTSYSQCVVEILNEDFDNDPVIGAVTSNIYGDGNRTDGFYILDATPYGWFNVIDGLNNVDVYNRHLEACEGALISVSLYLRSSIGEGMNVDLIAEDDLGDIVSIVNVDLPPASAVYQLETFSFILPATTGFNFRIHTNTAGSPAGVDLCVENLVISRYDTTPPTASTPTPVTVNCFADIPVQNPDVVINEADNCGTPTVTFISETPFMGSPCFGSLTRTYRVSDGCYFTDVDHVITVLDGIVPTASPPVPTNVNCIGGVPPPNPAVVIDENDNCSTPTVAFVSETSDGGTCPEVITRVYSVTDNCGNSINVTHMITVNDVTNPTAIVPLPINVECIGDVPTVDPEVILGEADNCSVPTVVFVSETSDGGTCPEVITRVYSVTDDCGNSIDITHIINVIDTTPPTATTPAPTVVNCLADTPINPEVVLDEADNCSVPTVAFSSETSDGGTCPEVITRVYTVTDDCGNSIDVTRIITVNDLINPTASAPLPLVVNCIAEAPIDPTVVLDEADNCSIPTVAFVSETSDGGTCPEVITRVYSVADDCGNSIDVAHIITINDIINPTATAPVPINVECFDDVPPIDPEIILDEADNCSVPTVAFVSETSDGGTCPEIITRVYAVIDDCGNSIELNHVITVNDITNPTASNPAPTVVACIGDLPPINPEVIIDEADNCSFPTVAFVSETSDGGTCPEIITRVYSVTDDCGNTIDVAHVITINDLTNPTASAPAPTAVGCIDDVPPVDIEIVLDESDNCSIPIVTFVSETSDGGTCPEIITRVYSVTDDCGNSIDLNHIITVHDITNPTASNPATINVSCTSDVPAPDPAVVIDEADNCTIPTVIFVSDISDGNTCNTETIERTYAVSDDCGNSINVTQTIIIDVLYPTVEAGTDQGVCEDVPVTLTALNPDAATLIWTPSITDGIAFFPPIGITDYTVTASVCSGECTTSSDVTVTVNPLPIINFEGNDLEGCPDHEVDFSNLSTETFDCYWQFGDGSSSNDCGPISHTYWYEGSYDVTLEVTSAEGCTSIQTIDSYIDVLPNPIADFTFSPQQLDAFHTDVIFENNSTFATMYDWDFGDATWGSDLVNPSHAYPLEIGGEYTTILTAFNEIGCSATVEKIITIDEVPVYYVPNAFTPDGDDFNQTFKPVFTTGYDPYNYHLTIFNRWGTVVFESYDASYGWDGTYGNNGIVNSETYIWQIEFGVNISDQIYRDRGTVTLLN